MKNNTIKNRKNIYFSFFFISLFIFFISTVSSQDDTVITTEDIGNFRPNKLITLVDTCSNCTYINVTSIYSRSNSSIITSSQVVMTKTGTFYSYNYPTLLSSGEYSYCTSGDPDGTVNNHCINFTIGQGILLPILLLGLGLVFLIFGVFSKEYIVGFVSGIFLTTGGMYVLIYGLSSFNDLYTKSIAYPSLFLGLIVAFASAYEAFPQLGGGSGDED